MSLHNSYMLIISALFAAVSAVLVISLIRHHKSTRSESRFSGPTGTVQFLWALVPVAILGYVDYTLISIQPEAVDAAAPSRIEVATAFDVRDHTAPTNIEQTKVLR